MTRPGGSARRSPRPTEASTLRSGVRPLFFVRRPSAEALDRLLTQARGAAPTYEEIGATRQEAAPAGFRLDADEIALGVGDAVFDRAVTAVRRWQAQRGAGLEVIPEGTEVGDRETTLLLIRALGLWTVAPCRVVYVEEEPGRFRFGYGTLPGHPERGEVSFAVTRSGHDEVRFRVSSFSRPVDPLARLAKPLTRGVQRRVTLRYLAAIRAAVG